MPSDRERDIYTRLNAATLAENALLNPHQNLPAGVTTTTDPAILAERSKQAQFNALSKMSIEELNILSSGTTSPEFKKTIDDIISSKQKEANYNDLMKSSDTGVPSISGNINMDQIVREAVARGQSLNDILDKIYSAQEISGRQKVEEQYNPLREQTINEQAALGTLRQGTGEAGRNVFDLQKQKSLTQLLNEIAQNKAQAQLGVAQGTAADIARARELGINVGFKGQELGLQGQQLNLTKLLETLRLRNQEEQFGKTFGLEQQKFEQQKLNDIFRNRLAENELAQAGYLGQLQARSKQPGILDYLNTAFTGLNTAANVSTAVKPKGYF